MSFQVLEWVRSSGYTSNSFTISSSFLVLTAEGLWNISGYSDDMVSHHPTAQKR